MVDEEVHQAVVCMGRAGYKIWGTYSVGSAQASFLGRCLTLYLIRGFACEDLVCSLSQQNDWTGDCLIPLLTSHKLHPRVLCQKPLQNDSVSVWIESWQSLYDQGQWHWLSASLMRQWDGCSGVWLYIQMMPCFMQGTTLLGILWAFCNYSYSYSQARHPYLTWLLVVIYIQDSRCIFWKRWLWGCSCPLWLCCGPGSGDGRLSNCWRLAGCCLFRVFEGK